MPWKSHSKASKVTIDNDGFAAKSPAFSSEAINVRIVVTVAKHAQWQSLVQPGRVRSLGTGERRIIKNWIMNPPVAKNRHAAIPK